MIALAQHATVTRKDEPPVPPRQFVVFKLAGELFALPVTQVREVLRMETVTPLPKAPAFVDGVISLRGRVMVVVDLRKRLDRPAGERTEKARILVVRVGKALVGLIVDAVEQVVTVPANAVQPPPQLGVGPAGEHFAGVMRVGQALVLIIRLTELFSAAENQQLEEQAWQKSSS